MEEKLLEIINLVNAKDYTYKSKSLELIETLKQTEKKKDTSEIQLTAILLNFLIGNYNFNSLIMLEIFCNVVTRVGTRGRRS